MVLDAFPCSWAAVPARASMPSGVEFADGPMNPWGASDRRTAGSSAALTEPIRAARLWWGSGLPTRCGDWE